MELSIVFPVYNVAPYLRESLDSIFKQDTQEFELIAINDGSTDNSLKILQEYVLKYKNIILINQKNMGPSTARNVGLENAKGKYVYFFDSDDILAEGIDLVKSVNQLDETDIIIFDANVFEEDISNGLMINNNNYIEPKLSFKKNKKTINSINTNSFDGIEYLREIKKRNSYSPVVWRRIYRKEFLIKNNINFHPGIIPAEDDLHFFQTLIFNPKIIYFQKVLLLHRIRKTSIMSTLRRDTSYQSFKYILDQLFDLKKKYTNEYLEEFIDWIINVFLRRCHSQKPSIKEAWRLLKTTKKNNVTVNNKTSMKMFLNIIGICRG